MNPAGLPEALQRRIIATNYRLGRPANAKRILELASDPQLSNSVRSYALHGLAMWTTAIETDPVLGHYRPQAVKERAKDQFATAITAGLRRLLNGKHDSKLIALATKLANDSGIALDEATLRTQVVDNSLDGEVRVATLDSLANMSKPEDDAIINKLLTDKNASVQAAAIKHGMSRNLDGIQEVALKAVQSGALEAARAAINGLKKDQLLGFWNDRESKLRKELWVDVYLKLDEMGEVSVKEWAAKDLSNSKSLAEFGGDVSKGEFVYRNQGACMQCHVINGSGGVQGPDLTLVAERLDSKKLLESLINPNAEIAEGYGLSTAMLKDGTTLVGRFKEDGDEIVITALDNSETRVSKADVASTTPPVSAMPPMAMTMQLKDLRDLVAYLKSRNKETAAAEDAASHGESAEEKIAK